MGGEGKSRIVFQKVEVVVEGENPFEFGDALELQSACHVHPGAGTSPPLFSPLSSLRQGNQLQGYLCV